MTNLIARMQHFSVEVSNTEQSIAFYRDVLGFKLTERHAAGEVPAIPVELSFMRLSNTHHELVLVHNPAKTYTARPTRPEDDLNGPPSFHHFALECDNRKNWKLTVARIRDKGVEIIRGPVIHSWHQPMGDGSWGENEAVYILDPDGHRIEIFWGLATIDPDGTHRTSDGTTIPNSRTEEL